MSDRQLPPQPLGPKETQGFLYIYTSVHIFPYVYGTTLSTLEELKVGVDGAVGLGPHEWVSCMQICREIHTIFGGRRVPLPEIAVEQSFQEPRWKQLCAPLPQTLFKQLDRNDSVDAMGRR